MTASRPPRTPAGSSKNAPPPPGGRPDSRWLFGVAAVVIVGAAVLAIVFGGGIYRWGIVGGGVGEPAQLARGRALVVGVGDRPCLARVAGRGVCLGSARWCLARGVVGRGFDASSLGLLAVVGFVAGPFVGRHRPHLRVPLPEPRPSDRTVSR